MMGSLSVGNTNLAEIQGFNQDYESVNLFAPAESPALNAGDFNAAGSDTFLLRALYDHGASYKTTLASAPVETSTTGRVRPEDLTPVPGSNRVGRAFKEKVIRIAEDLGTDPNYLMAIMSFESGGTFSPSIRNAAGSGATGLIQFMPSTARALGTTTDELAGMTRERQLDYVARYFAPYRGRLNSIEDAYMAVLYPAAIGRGGDHVLFRAGTTAYRQNSGLDSNRDGRVTVREAATPVRQRLGQPTRPDNTNNDRPTNNDGARTYTVRPGDTLSAIASRHGTTWQALARLNDLPNPNLIRPGQVIRLR